MEGPEGEGPGRSGGIAKQLSDHLVAVTAQTPPPPSLLTPIQRQEGVTWKHLSPRRSLTFDPRPETERRHRRRDRSDKDRPGEGWRGEAGSVCTEHICVFRCWNTVIFQCFLNEREWQVYGTAGNKRGLCEAINRDIYLSA